MDNSRRQHVGHSLSTGQLMRLASQVSQHPAELLSRTAPESWWETEPQRAGLCASSPSFQLAARNSQGAQLPMRKRAVWTAEECGIDGTIDCSRHDRGVSSRTRLANTSQQQAAAKLDASMLPHGSRTRLGHGRELALVDSPSSMKLADMSEAQFDDKFWQSKIGWPKWEKTFR